MKRQAILNIYIDLNSAVYSGIASDIAVDGATRAKL